MKRVGGSVSGDRWYDADPRRRKHLERAIRAFRTGGRTSALAKVGDTEVRLVILSSERSVRILAFIPANGSIGAAEQRLSPMQREVARRAATGSTVGEIARALGRSEETVRTHLRATYERLDVVSRVELAAALWKKK